MTEPINPRANVQALKAALKQAHNCREHSPQDAVCAPCWTRVIEANHAVNELTIPED